MRLLPAVSLAALLVAPAARADERRDLSELLAEPIVETASRTSESANVAPGTVTVLSADDIRRYGLHTIADALDFLSIGVFTQRNGNNTEVGARGALTTNDDGDHFLLLVDGHVVNEPLSGGANMGRDAGIPMEIVDHIEVIVGPGSVLYGTGAMLGVINIVTKSVDTLRPYALAEAGLGASYRLGAGGGARLSILGKRLEITGAAEYFQTNGLPVTYPALPTEIDPITGTPERFSRTGPATGVWGGRATQSTYEQVPSGLVRVKLGDFSLSLRGAISREGAPNAPLNFDDPLNRVIERWISVDASQRVALSSLATLHVRGYADGFDRYEAAIGSQATSCPSSQSGDSCSYSQSRGSRSVGLEVRTELDWLRDGHLVTTLGIDGRSRHVSGALESTSVSTGLAIAPAQGQFANDDLAFAAYGQQTWRATPWLALNAGARVDVDQRFPAVVSPRAAASVMPWPGGTLKLTFSQAFRAPSFVETDVTYPTHPRADALAPETVTTEEISLEQRFGAQRLSLQVFFADWVNLVSLHTLSGAEVLAMSQAGTLGVPYAAGLHVDQFRNDKSLDTYGFAMGFEGSAAAGTLHYGASGTAAVAREDTTSAVPETVAPRLLGNARLAYDLPGDLPSIGLAAQLVGPRIVSGAFDEGYRTLPVASAETRLRLTILGPVPGIKGLSYRAIAAATIGSTEPFVGAYRLATNPAPATAPMVRAPSANAWMGLSYEL